MKRSRASLVLEDGRVFEGEVFGAARPAAGEVVFNTGMAGYPESLTDPSYAGQILVLTYPLVGNYGVPPRPATGSLDGPFESDRVQAAGLIVSTLCEEPSHWSSTRGLGAWLRDENVPGIQGIPTRTLTKILREKGTMLGKIVLPGRDTEFVDPDTINLVERVSVKAPVAYGSGPRRIAILDCGVKANIIRCLAGRGVTVLRLPWDFDLASLDYDGLVVSNGPGNPKMCGRTIEEVRKAMARGRPIFGICLGNQILALAAGLDTFKMKYGHRSQNQPCLDARTGLCPITSQNHGYAVKPELGPDWEAWFVNANDGTNEGIRHKRLPFRAVQFHPEGAPGPRDTEYLFDAFLEDVG
jgi:carbamoyl-phosphate synthase small subunit